MRALRALLLLAGLAVAAQGVLLLQEVPGEKLRSIGVWAVGAVVLHDAVLAPLTIAVVALAASRIPRELRGIAVTAFIVWGTVTVAVANVLSGQGGKPDNDSILDRPYLLSWLVLSGVVVVAIAFSVLRRRLTGGERDPRLASKR